MDSTMSRVALVVALLVLVAALGALVSQPYRIGHGDVESEVLAGVMVGSDSPGANGAGPAAQAANRPAQPDGSGPGAGQQGPPGQGGPPGPPATPPAEPVVPPGRTFWIDGNAAPIFPHSDEQLTMLITNPHPFEIHVTELTIDVTNGPTDGCVGEVVGFKDDDGPTVEYGDWGTVTFTPSDLTIGPRQDGEYIVYVTLSGDTPNDCQDERWGLIYSGEATRSGQ